MSHEEKDEGSFGGGPHHQRVRRHQWVMAALGAGGLLLIMGGLLWAMGTPAAPDKGPGAPSQKTAIEAAGERLKPQEIWVERLETAHQKTLDTLRFLESKLAVLEKALQEHPGGLPSSDPGGWEVGAPASGVSGPETSGSEISVPETSVPGMPGSGPLGSGHPPGEGPLSGFPGGGLPGAASMGHGGDFPAMPSMPLGDSVSDQSPRAGGMPGAPGGSIQKTVVSMKGRSSGPPKTVENTLPAGLFISGILLGGVDASTSIQAASDPRPVLIRLRDPGRLPRGFRSDVKNCHVLASCYGDLSSERVFMRLETLTCVERLTGEVLETQVAGYVSGEDGRAGIRGVMVDRSGAAVRHSLVGGFFAGLSQFMGAQQQRATLPVGPFGAAGTLSPSQMLGAGASQGVGHALEKYADFFIKRAEQLQPVIQVAAGRRVDVVLTQGTSMGESSVRHAMGRLRAPQRRARVAQLEKGAGAQDPLQGAPLQGAAPGEEGRGPEDPFKKNQETEEE